MKNVLVTYATVSGSTAEIAEEIARRLRQQGHAADAVDINEGPNPSGFDAVILGSPIHNGELLPAAVSYIENHGTELAKKPVWLFSVGMGPALHGPLGGFFKRLVPPAVATVRDRLQARDYHAFAGVFARPDEFGIRAVTRILGLRYGDQRDWADVNAWADSTSRAIAEVTV